MFIEYTENHLYSIYGIIRGLIEYHESNNKTEVKMTFRYFYWVRTHIIYDQHEHGQVHSIVHWPKVLVSSSPSPWAVSQMSCYLLQRSLAMIYGTTLKQHVVDLWYKGPADIQIGFRLDKWIGCMHACIDTSDDTSIGNNHQHKNGTDKDIYIYI